MNKAVFWVVAPCRACVKLRFGGTYRLHLQGRRICERGICTCFFERNNAGLKKLSQVLSEQTSDSPAFLHVMCVLKYVLNCEQHFSFFSIRISEGLLNFLDTLYNRCLRRRGKCLREIVSVVK
jgi:hypothetical protein